MNKENKGKVIDFNSKKREINFNCFGKKIVKLFKNNTSLKEGYEKASTEVLKGVVNNDLDEITKRRIKNNESIVNPNWEDNWDAWIERALRKKVSR
jgi:hypothetical protein